jgi:hypothetical protein
MAGVALWSFGTLIAPPAAHLGIWALCATRVLVSFQVAACFECWCWCCLPNTAGNSLLTGVCVPLLLAAARLASARALPPVLQPACWRGRCVTVLLLAALQEWRML